MQNVLARRKKDISEVSRHGFEIFLKGRPCMIVLALVGTRLPLPVPQPGITRIATALLELSL